MYKAVWIPFTGEILSVVIEENNDYNNFGVAVMKDGNIVVVYLIHLPEYVM